MKNLKELKSVLTSKLNTTTFNINIDEQSFNVYPTNYINLTSDYYSIQIGHIIYENITLNNVMVDNINTLMSSVVGLVDCIGDYVDIGVIGGEKAPYRACIGGLGEEDQVCEDFVSIEALVEYLDNFEFKG